MGTGYKGINYVAGKKFIVDFHDLTIEEILGQERTTIIITHLMTNTKGKYTAPMGYTFEDFLESFKWRYPSWQQIQQIKYNKSQ